MTVTGKCHGFVKNPSQSAANRSLFSRSSVGVRLSHAVQSVLSECLTSVTVETSIESKKSHSLAFYHVLFRLGKPRYCGSEEGNFKGGELMGF